MKRAETKELPFERNFAVEQLLVEKGVGSIFYDRDIRWLYTPQLPIVHLTDIRNKTFAYFVDNPNRLISHIEIYYAGHPEESHVPLERSRVQSLIEANRPNIHRLRKDLEKADRSLMINLETIPWSGFIFTPHRSLRGLK